MPFDTTQKSVPTPDEALLAIATYASQATIASTEAYTTARYALLDALGCGILALRYPECTRLLGPVVPGMVVPNGSRVPGTAFVLDPVQAAFNIGLLIRWLDYNDTWLAAEWGHPSDNLGGILAAADYLSQTRQAAGLPPLMMRDVLTAQIKAYEIQGVLALENSLNRVGLDHGLFVKAASTAVVTALFGGNTEHIINALSHAWLDGGTLRTYRHAPNTGSRKSWAAADATSRAVWLALLALKGEMGYPTALTAKDWGFSDVLFKGQALRLPRPFDSYIIENILFKIFPAEFHAQTALECAIALHPLVVTRLEQIERVTINTHESAMRIINKTGPLHNPADRDHCLQYIVAIGLLKGHLSADDYEDSAAADPRIDALRAKITVEEDPLYSRDYLDPDKRSIANAVQVFFQDSFSSAKIAVEYPLGHRRRRAEGLPLLEQKFVNNLATCFSPQQVDAILRLSNDQDRLEETPVQEFLLAFAC